MTTNKTPTNWKIIELNEICDLQNGYAFKSSDYVSFSNTLNCRMSNIRPNGEFNLEYHPKFLPDSYAEKYSNFLLKDDDVIIAMTDMATDAKILGVPTVVSTSGKNLLLNQRVGKLIIKHPEIVYFPYLKYALNRESVKKYYLRFAGGGLQLNLGKSDLLSVKIPLPPLEEQKRIATIVDKADRIRRKRQEAIRLTEELGRSIFLDMFGDPVTNPKGWEIDDLGNVGILDRGKSKHRPRNDPSLLGGKYPLIQTGDVANSQGFIQSYSQTYSEKGLAQSRLWKAGTLCITIAANIADTGILEFDACFPDSIVGFTPSISVTTEYVKAWFQFFQPILEANAPQSAQKNINLAILRKLEIIVPPIEKQKYFSKLINKLRVDSEKQKQYSKEAENLFNSLLQRAFRGEL